MIEALLSFTACGVIVLAGYCAWRATPGPGTRDDQHPPAYW